MDLREFLLHKTNVGDIVVIQDAGWQTGLTMIDNEDLFIDSLDPSMLRRKVKNSYYDNAVEGLVCKIKRTDFGYEWPVKDT